MTCQVRVYTGKGKLITTIDATTQGGVDELLKLLAARGRCTLDVRGDDMATAVSLGIQVAAYLPRIRDSVRHEVTTWRCDGT